MTFSVAVFPYLKTFWPMTIGKYRFRSTSDVEGLPHDQSTAVREIAQMLFVKDDLPVLSGGGWVSSNEPRDHHVLPRFFLKNFAINEARTRVRPSLRKAEWPSGWRGRSRGWVTSATLRAHPTGPPGFCRDPHQPHDRDTYLAKRHMGKIASGRSDVLDKSDRPVLYALVRHLEARTPLYLATGDELSEMAADPDSDIPFTDEERRMYKLRRANPNFAKLMFNSLATRRFDERDFDSALILVWRSPFRLRTSTTPVITVPAPWHAAMDLPLPGMVPFQRVLTVNPYTVVTVVVGDFSGQFSNQMMDEEMAAATNRWFADNFARFPIVRHLVTGRDRLIEDMTWAPYEVVSDTPAKVVFRRTD